MAAERLLSRAQPVLVAAAGAVPVPGAAAGAVLLDATELRSEPTVTITCAEQGAPCGQATAWLL